MADHTTQQTTFSALYWSIKRLALVFTVIMIILVATTDRNSSHQDVVPVVVTKRPLFAVNTTLQRHVEKICKMAGIMDFDLEQNRSKGVAWSDNQNKSMKGIVDHYKQVLYCDIPKVASSSWYAMYKDLARRESEEREQWFSEHQYPWYFCRKKDRWTRMHKMGFNRLTRGADAHTEYKDGLPDPRKEYFKFIVVRHPLERLASAYLNRVKGLGSSAWVRTMKNVVMRKHHDVWKPGKQASFEEYLAFLAIPDEEMIHDNDYHWKTYQSLCDPCTIKYDYVAHMETMEDDFNVLLPILDAEDYATEFPEKNVRKEISYKYGDMYRDVRKSVMSPLIKKYKADAEMFGYSFDDYLKKRWV